jgi:hypothetical protein
MKTAKKRKARREPCRRRYRQRLVEEKEVRKTPKEWEVRGRDGQERGKI